MDARDVPENCALAGSLAKGGLTEETLAEQLPESTMLAASLAWLGSSLEAVSLLRTTEQSADRISDHTRFQVRLPMAGTKEKHDG